MSNQESAVTVRPAAAVSTEVRRETRRGFEGLDKSDFRVPFVNVLQAQSPEVMPGTPKFVNGARPGQLFNTVTKAATDKITFVPVDVRTSFIEWRPRTEGGGFVAEHKVGSTVVARALTENGQKMIGLQTEEGNDLVLTKVLFGIIVEEDGTPGMPFALSLTKTKISRYQDLMTVLAHSPAMAGVDLFGIELEVSTGLDTNPKTGQTYYNVRFNPSAGPISDVVNIRGSLIAKDSAAFLAAEAFFNSIAEGAARVDHAEQAGTAEAEATPADKVF